MSRIKEKFGSVHNFMLKERLHWDEDDLQPRGKAFEYEGKFECLSKETAQEHQHNQLTRIK